jgi:23S rRNA (cytidine1920-2'-O)/16S rRNA (cytidine1409-2'-O)-methyltransferase
MPTGRRSAACRIGSSGPPGRRVADRRLDLALVDRGLVPSRSAAARAVADGRVRLNGAVATRPAAPVRDGDALDLTGDNRVGRGALKLEAALAAFLVPVAGRLALDLGASTGGFTQVLLEHGARRVIALDVGHGQLVPALREDPRVAVVEGVNARFLDAPGLAAASGLDERPGLITADLSFISLRQVLPAVLAVAAPDADALVLIKPQFEVGRGGVREGLVRDPAARAAAVRDVLLAAERTGFVVAGVAPSPVVGAAGNVEALAHLTTRASAHRTEWDGLVERATRGT